MSTNTPVSIWRSTNGLSEYNNEGAEDIVDILDVNLVDIEDTDVIDTGVIRTLIPSTIWEEDDSI